jgi:hypothetical protein
MRQLSLIEGINKEEQAADVSCLDKMRENIANPKIALECQAYVQPVT